jgi:hypothetical protein
MPDDNSTVIRTKRLIGAVAVALLLVFTVLAFLGYLPFLLWIALALMTWGAANLLLRRVGRKPL